MEKHIPVTQETSRAKRLAIGIGIGAAGVATVVSANALVNHVKETANENMGNAIYEQVTGEQPQAQEPAANSPSDISRVVSGDIVNTPVFKVNSK